jgi:uncharacterized protein (TIGR03067 family)
MRPIKFVFLILTGLAVSARGVHAQAKPDSLTGAWIPVAQAMGGKALPSTVFEKSKLIIGDSTYTLFAESVDKGLVKYNGNKMDIYGKQGANAGMHFMAIYKLENGQLTICYNLKGDSYPETFDTTGKPLFFISTFKKETR